MNQWDKQVYTGYPEILQGREILFNAINPVSPVTMFTMGLDFELKDPDKKNSLDDLFTYFLRYRGRFQKNVFLVIVVENFRLNSCIFPE